MRLLSINHPSRLGQKHEYFVYSLCKNNQRGRRIAWSQNQYQRSSCLLKMRCNLLMCYKSEPQIFARLALKIVASRHIK